MKIPVFSIYCVYHILNNTLLYDLMLLYILKYSLHYMRLYIVYIYAKL